MFKTEAIDGKIIFTFESRMDTATCSVIEGDVIGQLDKARSPVVFNIGKVDFVSSAFLRICIMAAKRAADGNFHVKNAAPHIKKVFKIAGIDKLLVE
jgi:stage II sporulation protein AA (anti-sigma F factor antagonist)